ncbi:hypothetical protein [Shimia sp. SDUM112013]|uniref:hypothetical protein n=1 Tax=Shimia sp. SDUM112013 TaxID=3136160 RepID=UPI0032ED0DA7
MSEDFERMLSGGHPNSLGRTIEVVETVLAVPTRMDELLGCYKSQDGVVRLRVSNALRRVQARQPDLIVPLIDKLIEEIGALDQASAQWTLPKLFEGAHAEMSEMQRARAVGLVKRNLEVHSDWIVLNNSIEYLATLANDYDALKDWLLPHLSRLSDEPRKSVARRAGKYLGKLEAKQT